MDLLTTVRKEGSRGGRGDFKWSDVQSSTHRENYLGHSLMAPVGRWQKGRDLNWYAKGETSTMEGETEAEKAVRERKEEIKKIQEAEQDALARALGFEVAPRNANHKPLGTKKEIDQAVQEAVTGDDEDGGQGGKGVGFGVFSGPARAGSDEHDVLEGNAERQDAELSMAVREYRRRHGEGEKRRRSRSRSRDRPRDNERKHGMRQDRDRDQRHRRHSRSQDRYSKRFNRSASRSPDRRRSRDGDDRRHRRRARSRSPTRRTGDRKDYHRRDDYDRRR